MSRLASPLPERMREARLARGYSISDLADAVGVTRQAISQFELGQTTPKWEVMLRIARTLRLPISYFTTPFEKANQEGVAFFRSLASATKKTREMCESRAGWVWYIYSYLERFVDFPEVRLFDSLYVPDKDSLTPDDIEGVAKSVRKAWGLGLGPISDVTLLLEKQGVVISRSGVGDFGIDAYSKWFGVRPFIFLNSDKESACRSRFDAAHELGHLLLHRHVDKVLLSDGNIFKRIEKEANRFAGAFLLPEESFCNEVMSSSLDHFIALKERWKVSIAAMIYRCEELELLSENQVLYLRRQMAKRKMKTKEPLDDVLPVEMPVALKNAISLLLENNVQTVSDLEEALKLPEEDIEFLCNLPPGYLKAKRERSGKVVSLRRSNS